MRKVFTIVLALILAMGLSTSSFAATSPQTITSLEDGAKTVDIDVTGTYVGSNSTREVYSVDVEWGAMSFTYSDGSSTIWNPKTHTYETLSNVGWTADGNTVTVTNHSSLPVDVEFSFVKNVDMDADSTYTGKFTEPNDENTEIKTVQLARATAGTEQSNAPNKIAALKLDGTFSEAHKDEMSTNLGKIVVKLSPVTVAP